MVGALMLMSAAGTATQAVGQYKAGQAQVAVGKAQQAASNSQAEISDYNAHVADLQATDAVQIGAQEEARFRTQIRTTIGAQRAGMAASNIDVGFGSAVDVQADAAYLGELDALQIRTNAARQAWGYQVQAYDYRKQADVLRKTGVAQAAAGEAAAAGAKYQIAGTILGGATSLLQMKYGFDQANG